MKRERDGKLDFGEMCKLCLEISHSPVLSLEMLRAILSRTHGDLVRIDPNLHTLILVHLALGFLVDLAIDLQDLGPAFGSIMAEWNILGA